MIKYKVRIFALQEIRWGEDKSERIVNTRMNFRAIQECNDR